MKLQSMMICVSNIAKMGIKRNCLFQLVINVCTCDGDWTDRRSFEVSQSLTSQEAIGLTDKKGTQLCGQQRKTGLNTGGPHRRTQKIGERLPAFNTAYRIDEIVQCFTTYGPR
jgi:hypothetical protein